MRKTDYLKFQERLQEVLNSRGELAFPNVKEITDPQEGLNLVNRTSVRLSNSVTQPYELRIQNFDPPKGVQTHERTWYPHIFLNSGGMGGQFNGSGVIVASPRHDGVARVFTFAMCEHEWDESGANHSRGWHPKVCTKCGFDASIDSGD